MKKPLVLLYLLVLIYGISWPINKNAFSYTPPYNFNELRFVVGTVAAFLISLVSRNFIWPRKGDWPMIIMMAIFQMGLPINLANYGVSLTGAGRATFLIFTTSIWLISLTALFYKRLRWSEAAALVVGTAGVFILVNPWQTGPESQWIGDLFLLGSSFMWAIGIFCARHMTWPRSPLQLLPWVLLISMLGSSLVAYVQGQSGMPEHLSWPLVLSILYSGFIVLGLGQWILLVVTKHLKSSVVSLGLIWVPVISLFFSVMFLNEEVTFSFAIAILLIMAGILLHIYSEKREEKDPPSYIDSP